MVALLLDKIERLCEEIQQLKRYTEFLEMKIAALENKLPKRDQHGHFLKKKEE